jgi:hypothetical protein
MRTQSKVHIVFTSAFFIVDSGLTRAAADPIAGQT